MKNEKLVEMCHITKNFPGVRALDDVDFDLVKGEIHALVGENGAGKSTLAKILGGIQKQDSGTIQFGGKFIEIQNSRFAQKLGIGMVFQEINLIPILSVAQNLLLAHEPSRFGVLVDKKELIRKTNQYLAEVNMICDPNTPFEKLGVAEKQLVALARALSFQPKVLILDETTASLTGKETNQLFSILKKYKSSGGSVIYISHRLNEVFEIADRITVLKDGKLIKTDDAKNFTAEKLILLMVGQKINVSHRATIKKGDEVLRINDLTCKDTFQNVSIHLNRGEVVGMAGLVGSGRTELAEAVFGIRKYESGEIFFNNIKQNRINPSQAIKSGIGFIPEDRHKYGLCLGLSVQNNIIMASLKRLFPNGILYPRIEADVSEEYIQNFRVATSSKTKAVRYLSGGNQQKVVLAKWLCSKSDVFIFDEPTRGIDVKAKSEIYELMNEMTKEGASILMISSELPEIMLMSDRVYIMREGQIVAECAKKEIKEDVILRYMLGGKR